MNLITKDSSIKDLGVSVRTFYALKRAGVHTVGQLATMSDTELLKIRNFGIYTLTDLKNCYKRVIDENKIDKKVFLNTEIHIDDEKSPIINYPYICNYIDNKTYDSIYKVHFNVDGHIYTDCYLNKTNLPSRAVFALQKNGITTLKALIDSEYDKISYTSVNGIKGLGKTTFNEMMDYLKSITKFIYKDITPVEYNLEDYIIQIYERIYYIAPYEDIKNAFKKVYHLISDKLFNNPLSEDYNIEEDEDILQTVFSDETLCEKMDNEILKIIGYNRDGLEYVNLSLFLPKCYNTLGRLPLILHKFVDKGYLEYMFDKKYHYPHPFLSKEIEGLDNRKKDILISRFNGTKLDDIAKKYKVSKARIGQEVYEGLCMIKACYEDRFYQIWRNYNIPDEAFKDIFGVNQTIIGYFNTRLKNNHDNRGDNSLNDFIKYLQEFLDKEPGLDKKTKDYTEKILIKSKNALQQGKIYIYDKWVEMNRANISLELMKNEFSNKPGTFTEIYNRYIELCHYLNLENLCCIKEKAFISDLMRLDNIIHSRGKQLRYYDVNNTSVYKRDLLKLLENIGWEKYKLRYFTKFKDQTNYVIISIDEIFNDYRILMEQYDIQNKEELHNICNKYMKYLPDFIIIQRMPNIAIKIK